jgi:hypothetical protein
MRRRSRASRKEVKAGGRKAEMAKRHTTPVVHGRGPSNAGLEAEATRLRHELDKALVQQAATAGVLKLISSSFGDPQPVFANILASAVRICDADIGIINRWDGDALHLVATHNMPQKYIELRTQSPYKPHQHSPSGRMLETRRLIHIVDLAVDQAYLERNPPAVAAFEIAGVRTVLCRYKPRTPLTGL